jgi:hypothetical protein
MRKDADWDIAGFTDNYSKLGKRIPSGEILVDHGVQLSQDGTSLIWPMARRLKPKVVKPTPLMFSQFIDLREGTPSEICAFAEHWGRLYLRQDGTFIFGGFVVEEAAYREPIHAWRYLASRAYAVLSIAASLAQNQPGRTQDWQQLSSLEGWIKRGDWSQIEGGPFRFGVFVERGFTLWARRSVEVQRKILGVELNLWMKLGRPGLYLGLDDSNRGWQLELFFGGKLLAALALQLALTVSGVEAPHLCSGCKHLYIRTKKNPKTGDANYCDRCGRDEALRQADNRRRTKILEARRLHAEGMTVDEITERIAARSVKTVRRWIQKGK